MAMIIAVKTMQIIPMVSSLSYIFISPAAVMPKTKHISPIIKNKVLILFIQIPLERSQRRVVPAAGLFSYQTLMLRSFSTLSCMGGWVLKSLARVAPERGFTINMCEAAGLTCIGMW